MTNRGFNPKSSKGIKGWGACRGSGQEGPRRQWFRLWEGGRHWTSFGETICVTLES